jgi:hypothetical protein
MRSFLCLGEDRYRSFSGLLYCRCKGKVLPSAAPHPRNRRFAHAGKNAAAVEIFRWNFCGLTNYKAFNAAKVESDVAKAAIPTLCRYKRINPKILQRVPASAGSEAVRTGSMGVISQL